jgi:hypothetical protein
MESLHKEIDLIQEVIKRMANNSFLIKGWYVTLLSAILVINKDQLQAIYDVPFIIMLVPVFLFWYLDAYYLRQEIVFRKLYQWVIQERRNGNQDHLFDLNAPGRFGSSSKRLVVVMFSPSLLIFYFIPLLILLFMIVKAH